MRQRPTALGTRRAQLPRELRLRGALTVSQASVEWRKDAGLAAQGSVNVVGGPLLGFAVRSLAKRVEVEKFTVRDDASDATLSGSLEGGDFKATYKGRLAGSSIERTFAKSPVALGELQGDFQAGGNLKRPDTTRATGYLQGPAAPDGNGPSLEIIDPLTDPTNAANWRASLYNGGSPGRIGLPPPTVSSSSFNYLTNHSITIQFDHAMDASSISASDLDIQALQSGAIFHPTSVSFNATTNTACVAN